MKIYQHVDELNDRDGIGNDIYGFQFLFNNLKLENSVITRINNSKANIEILSSSKPPFFFSDDIHILHYGGAGYPTDFFQEIPGKKILRFHNMTPVSFFKNYLSDEIFKTFERNEIKSHLELYSLHRSISCILSDSAFNQSEYLQIVGEKNKVQMEVIPVIRNYPLIRKKKDPSLRIGFLGRWVPNKKLEDLLFTLSFLLKINKNYKLILLGKRNSIFESYSNKLFKLIEELELSNAIEIYDNLSDEALKTEFQNLDLYLSMSEHEGFGIPILEAMGFEIPVLAYASSAVIETVQDAGLLFTKKNYPLIAELIHKILSAPDLKASLLKSQTVCLKKYNEFPFQEKFLQILKN